MGPVAVAGEVVTPLGHPWRRERGGAMGHVVRRSGNWQASIRGPDGREKSKTFARKVDAQAWLTSVDHSIVRHAVQ